MILIHLQTRLILLWKALQNNSKLAYLWKEVSYLFSYRLQPTVPLALKNKAEVEMFFDGKLPKLANKATDIAVVGMFSDEKGKGTTLFMYWGLLDRTLLYSGEGVTALTSICDALFSGMGWGRSLVAVTSVGVYCLFCEGVNFLFYYFAAFKAYQSAAQYLYSKYLLGYVTGETATSL